MPKSKQAYLFWFTGIVGLQQHNGGSGRDKKIWYSPVDYTVEKNRQNGEGPTEDFLGKCE